MSWRDSAEEAVAQLARKTPSELAGRMTVEKLKVLAKALVVSGSRPKLEVATLIVERCDQILRKVAHEMGVETPVPLAVRRQGASRTDTPQDPARAVSVDQGAA